MCSAHRSCLFSLHPSEPATSSCCEMWAGTQTQGLSRARVQPCVRATAQPLHHNPAQHGQVPRVGNSPCPGECCPQCQTQQYPSRGWDTNSTLQPGVSQVGWGGLRCICRQQSQAPDMVTAAPGACKMRCPTRNLLQPSQRQRQQSCLPGGEQWGEHGTISHTSTSPCPSWGWTQCWYWRVLCQLQIKRWRHS